MNISYFIIFLRTLVIKEKDIQIKRKHFIEILNDEVINLIENSEKK